MKIPRLQIAFAALFLASCTTADEMISETPFSARPAMIDELESKRRLTKMEATVHRAKWQEESEKREAHRKWYNSLTPEQKLAYEQSRMQLMNSIATGMAIHTGNVMRSTDALLDRQSYDQRTRVMQMPQHHYHNIQGTIYHR